MISPTACGALFGACTTPQLPQPSQNLVEPSWNPRGTLVEPSWNLTSGPPKTTPEPIWAETPKLPAVGGKGKKTRAMSERTSDLGKTLTPSEMASVFLLVSLQNPTKGFPQKKTSHPHFFLEPLGQNKERRPGLFDQLNPTRDVRLPADLQIGHARPECWS